MLELEHEVGAHDPLGMCLALRSGPGA